MTSGPSVAYRTLVVPIFLRYFVALLLAFATTMAHAAPSVLPCVEELVSVSEECCEDDDAHETEPCTEDGCAACCPVRTAVASAELTRVEPATRVERVVVGTEEPAMSASAGDIFQPPRA